jgi:transcriptional regulator with XRE-family HTH domain
MQIDSLTPNAAVLEELGRRLRNVREQRRISRDDLALQAGIGSATLERMESGSPGQMTSWIRVLMTLNMEAGLNGLLPENYASPLQEVIGRRKRPQASKGSGKKRWGDEQ